ncbi:MAG: response regulator [Flavobacteriaceae bacterium]
MKIISVDDSESISTHLSELIDKIDSFIYSGNAFTITEALELIETVKPKIVFLDIFLKDENGLGLLAHLKEHLPDIVVIMLTNNNELIYRNKAKQLGADYFLDKSYEFDKIPELLNSLIKK